jgi:hypothetical protein
VRECWFNGSPCHHSTTPSVQHLRFPMPKRTDIHSVLIIGAGPIIIGQACEFDYSGTQACKALKEEGYRVVLINSNPATIMTDPEFADRTYIEPITPETVEKIIVRELAEMQRLGVPARPSQISNLKSQIPSDHLGAFAVTAGIGLERWVQEFEAKHDDYHAIMIKALADRLAEAFAEAVHARVRREFWGYAASERLTDADLIAEEYRGIRPAPGYPACPDHTEKGPLFDLLGAREIGMSLTESYAMLPASSVSGFYLSHPQAQYFAVGKIAEDQAEDYARRKGLAVDAAERWLAPVLAYDR